MNWEETKRNIQFEYNRYQRLIRIIQDVSDIETLLSEEQKNVLARALVTEPRLARDLIKGYRYNLLQLVKKIEKERIKQ